jgi:hypothetical protein
MLWHELAGGLALRRGDLAAARAALLPLVELALESDEAQRVVPMAGVVLPYALAAGDPELLRRVGGAALGYLERRWEVVSIAPVARALARGRADDLLRRLAGRVGVSSGDSGHRHVAVDVVTGLLALADGDPARAAAALAAAAASERGRGWAYRAACIEVDLADALAAAGRGDEAEAARGRADAVLAPLGVVNPY